MARNDRQYEPVKKEFNEQVITIDRVSRVVKGGRRFRFRALVVIGDGKNRVGVGVAKGADVQSAIAKAVEVAKKKMITINTYKTTIPHEVLSKESGAKIYLKPASPGTGIIAGGTVRAVLDVTGIKDVLSKSIGSSNKVNVAYATIKGLQSLVASDNWVTNRDKKTPIKPEIPGEKSIPREIRDKKPAPKDAAVKKATKKTVKAKAK